jgi:hypothetical protein
MNRSAMIGSFTRKTPKLGDHTQPFDFPDLSAELQREVRNRRLIKWGVFGCALLIAAGLFVGVTLKPTAKKGALDGTVPIPELGEGVFPNIPTPTTTVSPKKLPVVPVQVPVRKKVVDPAAVTLVEVVKTSSPPPTPTTRSTEETGSVGSGDDPGEGEGGASQSGNPPDGD